MHRGNLRETILNRKWFELAVEQRKWYQMLL